MKGITTAVLVALAATASPSAAAPALPTGFTDTTVVASLAMPCGMAFLPDGRLLFTEQKTAIVRLLVDTVLAGVHGVRLDSVGVVDGVQSAGFEQGLLGILVDRRWPLKPFIYVHCNDVSGHVRISRYRLSGALTGTGPLVLDVSSRYDVLADVPDNNTNHNGGTLRHGRDGSLYASFGEDEARCPSQDVTSLLGKILRLDISRLPEVAGGPAPKALIAPADNPFAASPDSNARLVWAYGLRNPFRFHVDAVTGDLFVTDVGEAAWEEVDHVSQGGLNFGWPLMEGPDVFIDNTTGLPWIDTHCDTNAVQFRPGVAPIYAFDRRAGSAAFINAGVYRRPAGAARPFSHDYDGDDLFTDYYQGFVRRLKGSGDTWGLAPAEGQPDATDWATGIAHTSEWLIAPDGTLWYSRQSDDLFRDNTGSIHRITPPPESTVVTPPGGGGVELDAPVPTPTRAADGALITFRVPTGAAAKLRIFDLAGRRVRVLPTPASGSVTWDGTDDDGGRLRPAVYVIRLDAAGVHRTRRLILIR